MLFKSLLLKNFRRYDEAHFEFTEGVNAVCGPNAVGKTTLLEALYLLVSGQSFRTSHLSELIKEGRESFLIEGHFEKHGVAQRLALSYGRGQLRLVHNRTSSSSLLTLLGILSGVLMSPDDAALIKGGPQVRRRYLDLQIAQSDPLYVYYARRYQRALKQRNALLKRRSVAAIEGWEEELAAAARYMSGERKGLVGDLSQGAREYYRLLAEEEASLCLEYLPSINQDEYLQQLRQLRQREMQIGYTLKGPHKDDLTVAIEERPLRHFGSEGQQRSAIVALRLSEWQQLKKRGEAPPLMLFDDLAISLDISRCRRLYALLPTLGQVFLTTTELTADVACRHVIELTSSGQKV